ncbi:hypothetical protein LCI18_003938 [Fusarium solani-melongenae]|uniref:Uncharacterized protein n=1 Tax=Fusarium solani subsp. cucurbitae TaxID=2747967 RepID=A0ACD3YYR1_FUSSC|nr:hypothetical protein LCI18_003938 [Fusarium solani-melongenae]
MATLTRLPPEVLRQIILHAHDPWVKRRPFGDYDSYEAPPRRYELKAPKLCKNLRSLRLVDHTLCQAVTPLLFRHVVISVNGGIDRLLSLSRSPLRRFVLRLGLVQHPDSSWLSRVMRSIR